MPKMQFHRDEDGCRSAEVRSGRAADEQCPAAVLMARPHFASMGRQAQFFGGLPRFGKSNPCMSTALRKMPARFIASVRSGPGGSARATSSAAKASTSRSNRGFGSLIGRAMIAALRGRCWIVRLPRFAVGRAAGVRFEGVAGLHPGFGVGAFRAFVAAMLETLRSRCDANRYHPHMTVRAARTVDWQ
jgi:hypothetical protein